MELTAIQSGQEELRVGDRVVCVDPDLGKSFPNDPPTFKKSPLVEGSTYTIKRIAHTDDYYLYFKEFDAGGWCMWRFRKLTERIERQFRCPRMLRIKV
jgi:hypothetical protein